MLRKVLIVSLVACIYASTANAGCPYGSPISTYRPIYIPQPGPRLEVPPRPDQIQFGGFAHVDALAAQLETLMTELCLDLYYNYSHNPGFRQTYTEAYQLLLDAKAIHNSHHHHNHVAVQQRLKGADALFHHIEDDVRGWTRVPHRQIGTLGIVTKMKLAEEALHHLMEDVGVHASDTPPVPESLSSRGPTPVVFRFNYR